MAPAAAPLSLLAAALAAAAGLLPGAAAVAVSPQSSSDGSGINAGGGLAAGLTEHPRRSGLALVRGEVHHGALRQPSAPPGWLGPRQEEDQEGRSTDAQDEEEEVEDGWHSPEALGRTRLDDGAMLERFTFKGPVVSHTCSCLAVDRDRSNTVVGMQQCVHGSLAQQWAFDSSSGQLLSLAQREGGLCLDAAAGSEVALAPCDGVEAVRPSQIWAHEHRQGWLRSFLSRDACLRAPANERPRVAACTSGGSGFGKESLWSLIASDEERHDHDRGRGAGKESPETPVVSGAGKEEFDGIYNATGYDNGQFKYARQGDGKETLNFADGFWILAKDYTGCWYRARGVGDHLSIPTTGWGVCGKVTGAAPHLSMSLETPVTTGEGEFSSCPVNCKCPVIFDCGVGFNNWAIGWSDMKKAWCCSNGDTVQRSTVCPTTTVTTTTASTTTSAPFDCIAGLSNWKWGWSELKKERCCRQFHTGAWKLRWEDMCPTCYYTWCCEVAAIVCTTTTTTTTITTTTTTITTTSTTTTTTTVIINTTTTTEPLSSCSHPTPIKHVRYGDECREGFWLESGVCCTPHCPCGSYACIWQFGVAMTGSPCCFDGILTPPTYFCATNSSCQLQIDANWTKNCFAYQSAEMPTPSPFAPIPNFTVNGSAMPPSPLAPPIIDTTTTTTTTTRANFTCFEDCLVGAGMSCNEQLRTGFKKVCDQKLKCQEPDPMGYGICEESNPEDPAPQKQYVCNEDCTVQDGVSCNVDLRDTFKKHCITGHWCTNQDDAGYGHCTMPPKEELGASLLALQEQGTPGSRHPGSLADDSVAVASHRVALTPPELNRTPQASSLGPTPAPCSMPPAPPLNLSLAPPAPPVAPVLAKRRVRYVRRHVSYPNDEKAETCTDLDYTGIRFRAGQRAVCNDLATYCGHPRIGKKVRYACARTCGMCELKLDALPHGKECEDARKEALPVFTVAGTPEPCDNLKPFCTGHPDSERVSQKCPVTCGLCEPGYIGRDPQGYAIRWEPDIHVEGEPGEEPPTTTTTLMPLRISSHDAPVLCGRRRRWGFCYTRRRRDFV